jgi:hypothetical protein
MLCLLLGSDTSCCDSLRPRLPRISWGCCSLLQHALCRAMLHTSPRREEKLDAATGTTTQAGYQKVGSVDPWVSDCLSRRCPYQLPLRQNALGLDEASYSPRGDRRRWPLVQPPATRTGARDRERAAGTRRGDRRSACSRAKRCKRASIRSETCCSPRMGRYASLKRVPNLSSHAFCACVATSEHIMGAVEADRPASVRRSGEELA